MNGKEEKGEILRLCKSKEKKSDNEKSESTQPPIHHDAKNSVTHTYTHTHNRKQMKGLTKGGTALTFHIFLAIHAPKELFCT